MRCGDCKHYQPARNPKTNRPLPSQDGECSYPVEWPKLPKAFLPDPWHCYGNSRCVQYPQRRPVWKDNREPCELFEARQATTKAAVQMALTMPNAKVSGGRSTSAMSEMLCR